MRSQITGGMAVAIAVLGTICDGQVQPTADDAGSTLETAGTLHVGFNACAFDYRLPRGMDTDLWTFVTEPGKVYSVRSYPIDDVRESIAALPVSTYLYYPSNGLWALGFQEGVYWTCGDGREIYQQFQGLARRDGGPTRYAIEISEQPDPGDPEGDDLVHATPLEPGLWREGTFAADRPPEASLSGYTYASPDLDSYSFTFEHRGLYTFEFDDGHGDSSMINLNWRGVSSRTTRTFACSTLSNFSIASGGTVEFRGSGTAWFTLNRREGRSAPSTPYRVRVTRTGTAPLDDHGDDPQQATVLVPGSAPAHATLRLSGNSAERLANEDWFAVQTVGGHSYEVRVERAGAAASGATVSDVLSEDGGHHADALPIFQQLAPNTNLLASIRFRGRNGAPVKFGLVGNGTATLTVIDQGAVIDDLGDPLTGPVVLSLASPTITGRLENPRDIDSFVLEPPATEGLYRVVYNVSGPASQEGFAPGYALTAGETRSGGFHNYQGAVVLTRRTDGQADSFPARLDLLNKPWPTTEYPLIGTTITYTLHYEYVGPLPTVTPPETSPDDAPYGTDGAPVLEPGTTRVFQRQGLHDAVDMVLLHLQPGRLYRINSRYNAGDLLTPDGRPLPTDGYTSDSYPLRQFVVSESGYYPLRQTYGLSSTVPNAYLTSMSAGVADAGEATDDNPNDAPPTRLSVGATSGRIDYAADRDRFILPYESGAYYRVTVTATAPVSFYTEETEYLYPASLGPIEYRFYFREYSLAPAGQTVVIGSPNAGAEYTIAVEKICQLHPADDLPEATGLRMPIIAGESVIIVRDRALDVDVVDFRVEAGRRYHLRFNALETPSTDGTYVYGEILDAQRRSVATTPIDAPFCATEDAVLTVEFQNSWETPVRCTLVDDGPGEDDFGTGELNRGHLQLGVARTGVLERADDVDLWIVDDAPPGSLVRITTTDLATGVEQIFGYIYSGPPTVAINASALPAGTVYPARYALRVDLVAQQGPLQPCRADLGRTGGVTATPNGGDRVLDNNDFVAFISLYFANSSRADLGSPGGSIEPDGWLDSNDFVAFIDLFFAGCE